MLGCVQCQPQGLLPPQPWNLSRETLHLLPHCRSSRDISQLHARLITTGLIRLPSLTSKVILTLSPSPHQPLSLFALRLLFTLPSPSAAPISLFNAVLKSFSHGCRPSSALPLLSLMLSHSLPADPFSLCLALKACSRLSLISEASQIHSLICKSSSLSRNLFLLNSLIALYSNCGLLDSARQVFDKMPHRDSVSWNSIIHGCVKLGRIDEARELFDRMGEEERNPVTWNSMIGGYAREAQGMEVARELFDRMPERDVVSWNTLIDRYAKCGRLGDAWELFLRMPQRDAVTWASLMNGFVKFGQVDIARQMLEEMPERDVVSWNVIMAGYVENGRCYEAIDIFHQLLGEGNLEPDEATLTIALSAIARLGCIDEAESIHNYIETNGCSLDGYLGAALIDMHAKCGNIEKALEAFECLEHKTVDHWNAMIGGLAIHGLGELALALFAEMQRVSTRPDDITFIVVLNACSHSGLLKEGLMCFELMRWVYNVEPKVQHYGCLVDLLGRAGHLEVARRLVDDMPIKPNEVVWRSLLSACGNHSSFVVGEQVAKELIGLDARNSSSYILLSNLYAGFGMWHDVSKVRMKMKDIGIAKEVPGCSWIELDGVIHEFVVGDRFHPQAQEIYFTLETMSSFQMWNSLSLICKFEDWRHCGQ